MQNRQTTETVVYGDFSFEAELGEGQSVFVTAPDTPGNGLRASLSAAGEQLLLLTLDNTAKVPLSSLTAEDSTGRQIGLTIDTLAPGEGYILRVARDPGIYSCVVRASDAAGNLYFAFTSETILTDGTGITLMAEPCEGGVMVHIDNISGQTLHGCTLYERSGSGSKKLLFLPEGVTDVLWETDKADTLKFVLHTEDGSAIYCEPVSSAEGEKRESRLPIPDGDSMRINEDSHTYESMMLIAVVLLIVVCILLGIDSGRKRSRKRRKKRRQKIAKDVTV